MWMGDPVGRNNGQYEILEEVGRSDVSLRRRLLEATPGVTARSQQPGALTRRGW